MLTLSSVSKNFGGLQVLEDLSLTIPARGIFGLIGPNGAGKTTVFNLITGLLKPSAGVIEFIGQPLVGIAPHQITRRGVARTFQNIRIFKDMTLLDNVLVAMAAQDRIRPLAILLPWRGYREIQRHEQEIARTLLFRVGLGEKANRIAGTLSYGEQRRLEIARALATGPKLLLLDEPAAGMNGGEKQQLMEEILKLDESGLSVLLIEHDMSFIMGLCKQIAVLNFGRLIAQGSPDEIRKNPQVIEAYLGQDEGDDADPRGKISAVSNLLEVSGLQVHYGVIEAVKGVDFSLPQGDITTLLGANGAGKSTTLLALSGLLHARAGSIVFDGVDLRNLPPHRIVEHGLAQVPEGREILTTLSVRENILLGAYRRERKIEITTDMENLLGLFPRLRERLDSAAGNLSGGEQQMLAIARALMAKPRLLLLDEPSMGLAPLLVQEIFKILRRLNEAGLTILLVEQNVRQALKIAHHAYVMENGKIVLSGPCADMLDNPKVISAYLGS